MSNSDQASSDQITSDALHCEYLFKNNIRMPADWGRGIGKCYRAEKFTFYPS